MSKKYTVKNLIIHGLGGKAKRLGFKIFESFFPKFSIDYDVLKKVIDKNNLNQLSMDLHQRYNDIHFKHEENKEYFRSILTWIGADKFLQENPLFIYPPNVAVIDFIIKQSSKEDYILEYGCGLGNLIIYLRQLGYKNILGYDNFSQINKETIEEFLNHFKAQSALLSREATLQLKNKIAICVCYFWNRLEKDIIRKEINNSDLEYILVDYHYAPRHIKNFRIAGIYKNLLIVFKRKK